LVSAFATADVAETSRYRLSFETTEAIIRMHLQSGDFDKAEQFYQSTLPYVSKFSAHMYNMLIKEYMGHNDLLRAEDTFEEMKAHSVLPTLESAATVIRLYGRLRRTAKAQRIFAETVARGFRPDTDCYNALIEALLLGEKVPEARATYEELISLGLEPTPETILVLIRLYGREGDPDTAHQIFEDMQLKYGFEKTVKHFNELLAAYAHNDRPDAVESVLFSGQGIAADEATYVTLLDMLIKRDQYDRAARIFEFLRSRHTDNGDESFSFEKSPALINIFIRMLTRCGDFVMAEYSFKNDALKPRTASSAVSSSGMTKVVADVDTYAAMIECYASQNRIDETLSMLEAMKNAIKTRRRVPDCYSLAIVVDLLGRSGRVADAISVWNDLTLNYRIVPDSMAYAVALETCARNGAIAHAVPLAESAINAASSGNLVLMTDFAEACKLLAQPRVSAKFQHRDEILKPLRLRNARAGHYPESADDSEAVAPISSQVVDGLRQLVQSLKKLPRKNS
jgi:pentatricopeptide repeat protein